MLSALIRMTLTHTFSHVSLASNTPPALNHVTSVEGTLVHMLGYVPVAVHLLLLSLRANLVRRVVHESTPRRKREVLGKRVSDHVLCVDVLGVRLLAILSLAQHLDAAAKPHACLATLVPARHKHRRHVVVVGWSWLAQSYVRLLQHAVDGDLLMEVGS